MGGETSFSELQLRRDLTMLTTNRMDLGKTKKRPRKPMMPTSFWFLILCGVGYYVWTHPVGLEVQRILYTIINPIEQVIHDLLTVE